MLRDNFAEWVRALDLTVRETTANSATLVMPFNARLERTGGIVSGQALMALADTAMVIAFCAAAGEFRATYGKPRAIHLLHRGGRPGSDPRRE